MRQAGSGAGRGVTGFGVFRETVAELRRVGWPSREQATRLTLLVIVISVSVGIILGVIDMAFGQLFRALI